MAVFPKRPAGFWFLADYSFYVKFIATYAPTFLRYDNSVLAIVIVDFSIMTAANWCQSCKMLDQIEHIENKFKNYILSQFVHFKSIKTCLGQASNFNIYLALKKLLWTVLLRLTKINLCISDILSLVKESYRYGWTTPHWFLKIWNQ